MLCLDAVVDKADGEVAYQRWIGSINGIGIDIEVAIVAEANQPWRDFATHVVDHITVQSSH